MDIRPESEISTTQDFVEKHIRELDKKQTGKFQHKKKSGETFDVEIYSTTILSNEKMIGSVIAIDITEKNRHQYEIMKAIIKTQENERYEIGGELHDNISQILVASQLSLGMLKKSVDPTGMQWLIQCKEYIMMAIGEIRNLSHRLAPAFLENKTLEEAFRILFKSMNLGEKYNVLISFDDAVKTSHMNPEIQIQLYRIMQEQLKNILKYSKATQIEVDLFISNNILSLRIADNGVGFNINAVEMGIGLANIKRRAEIFSGNLKIESAPGKGCVLDITIPL